MCSPLEYKAWYCSVFVISLETSKPLAVTLESQAGALHQDEMPLSQSDRSKLLVPFARPDGLFRDLGAAWRYSKGKSAQEMQCLR